MKAYIISDTEDGVKDIDGIYCLMTEEGEILAQHLCSNKCHAINDLYRKRPERIKEFVARFGEFNVDYLGCDDMTFNELIKRNHIYYQNTKE